MDAERSGARGRLAAATSFSQERPPWEGRGRGDGTLPRVWLVLGRWTGGGTRVWQGSVQPTRLVMARHGMGSGRKKTMGCAFADLICRASFWVAAAALRSFRDDGHARHGGRTFGRRRGSFPVCLFPPGGWGSVCLHCREDEMMDVVKGARGGNRSCMRKRPCRG